MLVHAIGGLDFVDPGSITLQFNGSYTSQTVRITIIDDAILEHDESFFGKLTATDPAVTVEPDQACAEATIIEDNDSKGYHGNVRYNTSKYHGNVHYEIPRKDIMVMLVNHGNPVIHVHCKLICSSQM